MSDRRIAWSNDTPSGKLGAKFLDENQLQNTFPNWKSLLARIDEQRAISKYAQKNEAEIPCENFPQMYDNVYAILGGRGTGKSSVLLTIRKHIQKNNPQDIVLPIVTPESIGSGSIMGWLMALVEREIVVLEHKIENLQRSNGPSSIVELDDFFDDCRFKKKNPLRRKYDELCLLIAAVCDGETPSAYEADDAAYLRVDRSKKQFRLIRELNEFWRSLANTATIVRQKSLENNSETKETTPLIIISFDDIDLAPERSMELLTTTFQYLTAPNIVIILSAAEKVLKAVLQIRMMERIYSSETSCILRDMASFDRSSEDTTDGKKMMVEFYNKVIPPARRFYLKKFKSISDKKSYYYSSAKQCFDTKDFEFGQAIAIDTLLREQINKLVAIVNETAQSEDIRQNFLVCAKNETFNNAYLLIFGEKNREISNACLAIINTISQLCEIVSVKGKSWLLNTSCKEVLAVLRQLLSTFLQANQETKEFERDNIGKLIYVDTETSTIHIGYSVVLEDYVASASTLVIDAQSIYFEPKSQEGDTASIIAQLKRHKKRAACMMMMLFFIENILILLETKKRSLEGSRELGILINSSSLMKRYANQNFSLRIFPRHFDVNALLERSPTLMEHIGLYINADIYDSTRTYDFLVDAVAGYPDTDAAIHALNDAMIWDRNWVNTVLVLLGLYGSDITLSDRSMLEISQDTQKILDNFAFGGEFNWNLKETVRAYIDKPNLETVSKKLIGKFIQKLCITAKKTRVPNILRNSKLMNLFDNCNGNTNSETIILEKRFSMLAELEEDRGYIKELQSFYFQLARTFWSEYDEQVLTKQPSEQQIIKASYQVRDFFKDYLDGVLRDIYASTYLVVQGSAVEEILQILSNIDLYQPDIMHTKTELYDQLSYLRQMIQDESEVRNEERLAISPIQFIQYLNFLNDALITEANENEGSVYDLTNEKWFASLQGYLKLIDRTDYLLQEENELLDSIPPTSRIAIIVNMLRFLFEYYIAACVLIAKDKQPKDQNSLITHSAHSFLMKLFVDLNAQNDQAKLKGLKKCMQQSHDELVQHFFDCMEGMHE